MVIHLYASWHKDKPLRNRTKPFIMLSLLAYYCFSTGRILVAVVLALVFSWFGDLLLIPDGIKWFTAGGISFMVSHFFFILSYSLFVDFSSINVVFVILLPALYLIAALVSFRCMCPYLNKALSYPMLLYLLINGGMNCFAWFRALSDSGLSAVLTVIGACLFFISDTALFFVRFNKNSRLKSHFIVMLTYALAELLIVMGLI